jgi:YegS/Rv2252/BmrU family lipid kinase
MRSILYIINPISGTRSKTDLQQLIEKETTQKKIPFSVFPSVASGDYSFLDPIIREQKVTDVVIAGGDGTVSQVVGSLLDQDVNFGIIPCGSGNGLAYAARIPGQQRRALEVIFNGRPVATDGFHLNEQFACMLGGLGFDAKIAHDFTQQPKRGLTTYLKLVIKNFFSAKTYLFEVSIDGGILRTEAFFISIANSNQFGNNLTIAPRASLSDGLLDIVIVTRPNKLSWALQMLKQISGRNKLQTEIMSSSKKSVIYFQAPSLIIKNPSGAPFHIDGEPVGTPKEVKIQVRKQCFRLLMPAN